MKRSRLGITLFCLAILFGAPVKGTNLYRHSLKAYPGAVCIDGTAAQYYTSAPSDSMKRETIHKSSDKGSDAEAEDTKQQTPDPSAAKNYAIFLEGGGYCHEAGACKWRCGVAPWLCTAKGPKVKQGFGILSDDATDNPSFHDYFKIDVPYCTGDMYIGRREGSTATLDQHFKGRVVLDAIIADLKKTTALDRAVNVVLSGSSAGGAGVAFNCNYLQALLPHASIWCVVDAAFYYPVPGPLHNVSACDSIDRVLRLGAELWEAPEVSSFDLHGHWWREIRPNLLIGTARFDRFGLETYCANVSSKPDLRDWEAGIVEKTQGLQEEDPQVMGIIIYAGNGNYLCRSMQVMGIIIYAGNGNYYLCR